MQIRPLQISEAEIVLALWNEACVEAVGYPLSDYSHKLILSNLRQYAQHETHHCLVTEVDNQVVSFITFGVSGHPVLSGSLGEIEELYAQPNHRQTRVALIEQAVRMMKRQGAEVITTRIAADEPDDIAFWHSLKWLQDTINFTIYSGLDEGSDDKAVWDSYSV